MPIDQHSLEKALDKALIEIVCAFVDSQGKPVAKTYQLEQGVTAADFLRSQSLLADSQPLPVMGIFSQKISHPEQYVLQDGDRLELYQPLILSPMDVRRARARAHPVGRMKRRL
ncbi:MAG: RnfH family protein [Gammaproteobacteria bacterium]|nr:RnfH family protein [Gammaproteobacteria bacterium]